MLIARYDVDNALCRWSAECKAHGIERRLDGLILYVTRSHVCNGKRLTDTLTNAASKISSKYMWGVCLRFPLQKDFLIGR